MGRVHRQWSLSAPLSRMDLMSEAWGLLLPPRTLRRYALTTFIAPPRLCFSYPAMTVRIRLARFGRRKEPFYRLVAADRRCPRDGRHLEVLGEYDPIPSARPASLQTFLGYRKSFSSLRASSTTGNVTETDGNKHLGLKPDRVKYWLSVGAQPTDTASRLLSMAGLMPAPSHRSRNRRSTQSSNDPR